MTQAVLAIPPRVYTQAVLAALLENTYIKNLFLGYMVNVDNICMSNTAYFPCFIQSDLFTHEFLKNIFQIGMFFAPLGIIIKPDGCRQSKTKRQTAEQSY